MIPKRAPGRPPLEASGIPSAAVHLKLGARDYDRVAAMAKQARQSVQDVIRSGIKKMLDERGNVV